LRYSLRDPDSWAGIGVVSQKVIAMTQDQSIDKPASSRSAPANADQRRREKGKTHCEELLDEALDESFPASDPPSIPCPPEP
jgi:hypothetical protein